MVGPQAVAVRMETGAARADALEGRDFGWCPPGRMSPPASTALPMAAATHVADRSSFRPFVTLRKAEWCGGRWREWTSGAD